MTTSRKMLPGIALAVGVLAAVPASGDASAVVTHASHRAFYEIQIGRVEAGSNIVDARGRMVAEWRRACDGWASSQRLVVSMAPGEGEPINSEVVMTSFETLDGTLFSFDSETRIGGETIEAVKGAAERPGPGQPGRATYNVPRGVSVDLPADTVFPFEHTIAVIEAAEALNGTIDEVPSEGSLLPETYHYSYGDSRAAILARMRQSMQSTVSEAWARRSADLPLQSPEEAIVLASIVEKETAKPEERAHIAGVFINRLKRGMRLQSDPTVAYGLTEGRAPLDRALTRSDLKHPTPYNTYVIKGLPPGPICNPGKAAIEAVLQPMQTKDLYFVADGNGGHAFAETYAQHRRNVSRWRRLQSGSD